MANLLSAYFFTLQHSCFHGNVGEQGNLRHLSQVMRLSYCSYVYKEPSSRGVHLGKTPGVASHYQANVLITTIDEKGLSVTYKYKIRIVEPDEALCTSDQKSATLSSL